MANNTNNNNNNNDNANKYKSPGSVAAFAQGPGRERFYNSIKFDSSGDLQRASEIDERMIREKYDEDVELADLEREILTGEEEAEKNAKSIGKTVQSSSRLGNGTAGKMVTRTEQAKDATGNEEENKKNKKEQEIIEEMNKESSGGKGGSNDAVAGATATTKKQDSGSNDGSNKLSESNESKLLRSRQQRGGKHPSGSGGSGDGSDDNNTKNKINNLETSGNEKMLIIKENGTNENAAEMNENDLLCDFGAEKQPMVVASPRKKSKTAFGSDVKKDVDDDKLKDWHRGRSNKQGDKNVKLAINNSNDNSNSSGRQGGRKQRNPIRLSKRNDSSSDDLIIPDEEETKNANLLSECDHLFVPPVAPLFKPPNHASIVNVAMHKSASRNIDVNDGTNAKAFGANGKAMNTINTIDDSLYDQQFQIEPELLSARPGSDDSFRLFDPAVAQGKSNEGSDELASGRGRRRRSSGRNTNNRSNSTRKTSGSDNSSYDEEAHRSREKGDNNTEESDSDVDISNDLSDEEVYEDDYEDKERLIDDLEDDLGENTNNHRLGRPLILGSTSGGGVGGQVMPGMLFNGRRAQRGRPPKNEKVAPSRAIGGKKTNSKGASNAKGNAKSNNKSSTSLATLTTIHSGSNKSICGDGKRKVKAATKMFDDRGEYTIAKVDVYSSRKRGKQADGLKSTAANTNSKMVGKRNLSSAMAKSASDNATNKRGRKNAESDTKSRSSSGLSEGIQTNALGHTSAGAKSTTTRGREPNPQGGPRRSKHHNPWGLDEAQALIEGVARCGGGKWADIKKLGFPEIENRTAVDLKDKWRNLLRIATLPTPSGRETTTKSGGDKKREIPRAMLDRVRELALLHAKNKERELAAKAAQAQQR